MECCELTIKQSFSKSIVIWLGICTYSQSYIILICLWCVGHNCQFVSFMCGIPINIHKRQSHYQLANVYCSNCCELLFLFRGYLDAGGIQEMGLFSNCTGGISRYVDEILVGESHMYQTPTVSMVYHTAAPFDPEGFLGQLKTTKDFRVNQFEIK